MDDRDRVTPDPTSSERSLPRISIDEDQTGLVDADGLRISRQTPQPSVVTVNSDDPSSLEPPMTSPPTVLKGSSDMAKPTADEHRPDVVPTDPPPPPPKKARWVAVGVVIVLILGALARVAWLRFTGR